MLFIIIPVFNRLNFTLSCLESLKNQSFKNFKIIVVDDGSTDGTSEILSTNYTEVIVLKGDGNLWWTASVNLGIDYALNHGADWVMTLNNDVIADSDFLLAMYSAAKKNPNAIIGALEMDKNTGKPIYTGELIDWRRARFNEVLNTSRQQQNLSGLHAVSHLPGRGLLIPRHVIEKIGMFDSKSLPHYLADYDFTHRAYKYGFPVNINYDARLLTYPEESGDAQNRVRRNISGYFNHLFTRKGGANLSDFTVFTLRNCPRKYLFSFLLLGYARRILGYWVK
ncbi:MAG TPA: glycosyltransferase family 2 protein [Anaerolineaceae bacterium]|nr:glycosyltransferase family 2 protein [Anaerolineaceae bacterium]